MPEWLKGADCKSASVSLRWFESISTHHFYGQRVRESQGSLFVNADETKEGGKIALVFTIGRPRDLCVVALTKLDFCGFRCNNLVTSALKSNITRSSQNTALLESNRSGGLRLR